MQKQLLLPNEAISEQVAVSRRQDVCFHLSSIILSGEELFEALETEEPCQSDQWKANSNAVHSLYRFHVKLDTSETKSDIFKTKLNTF